jgi:hypothetical protein
MVESVRNAIAVTSTEWRTLLGFGELRIAKRRVQQLSEPFTSKECRRLFAWMPTTVVGDENDTIVLELANDWLEKCEKVPAHSSELVLLPHDAVVSHHCVGETALAYLSGDAQREGIELTSDRYAAIWSELVAEQSASLELTAAEYLLKDFGLNVSLRSKRADGYTYRDVIQLGKNSKTAIRERPKHLESLLRAVREISNAVSGVHSTEAFAVAVNVEWVATRTGKDPLKNLRLREQVDAAIAIASGIEWSSGCIANAPTADVIRLIETSFPKAYVGDITAESVAHIVRIVMAAKDQTLSPKSFLMSMHRLREISHDAAALLGSAVAGALGPVMTRRLVRSLQMNDPVELDWIDS